MIADSTSSVLSPVFAEPNLLRDRFAVGQGYQLSQKYFENYSYCVVRVIARADPSPFHHSAVRYSVRCLEFADFRPFSFGGTWLRRCLGGADYVAVSRSDDEV